jgi:hypothetical protein
MDKNVLYTGITGEVLLAITGAAEHVVPEPEQLQTIGQLAIQLAIGIVTLWKLLKKPKKPSGNG